MFTEHSTLNTSYFREDFLQTEAILNPLYQHLYSCLTHRITRPGEVLPEVAPHIRRLTQPPEEVDGAAALRKIDKLYSREELKRKKKKGEENKGEPKKQKTDADDNDDQPVTTVGMTTPVRDFEALLADGRQLIPGTFPLRNAFLQGHRGSS